MPIGKRVFVSLALVFALTIVIGIFAPALVFGITFDTIQLTNNNIVWEGGVKIDGDNVVWGWTRTDPEPYTTQIGVTLYDGSDETTVAFYRTQGAVMGTPLLDISGSNVVWSYKADRDNEVFLYNGSTVTTLTDNTFYDGNPKISGNNVVWEGYDDGDPEIFFYDGSTVTKLTDNAFRDLKPQVSGSNVVWHGRDNSDYEIFFYDGSTVTTLTDNSSNDLKPQISGNNVVWQRHDGTDYEILFYDGSSVTTLTDNSYWDTDAQISGNNVVWGGNTGTGHALFFYNGSTVTTLTAHGYNPQISGSNVAWHSVDGKDSDIFFYDGSTVTTLTDNIYSDYAPQISGNKVAWVGGYNREVFMTTIFGGYTPPSDTTVTVEPSPGVIIDFGGGVIEGGNTTVTTSTAPITGTPIGFRFRGEQFNIVTDASFTPPIRVTIPYDDTNMSDQAEMNLKLFHGEGDPVIYTDVTISVDIVNNTITGEVTSLSPFIVGEPIDVSATVNIDPDSLNMQSKGGYVTAYLSVPTEYSVADIELNHISIYGLDPEQHVHAETFPIELGDDSDGDGKPDYLMVKFGRSEVQGVIGEPGDVELTVNFKLNGKAFEGSDTIKVINKGKAHFDSRDPASVEY